MPSLRSGWQERILARQSRPSALPTRPEREGVVKQLATPCIAYLFIGFCFALATHLEPEYQRFTLAKKAYESVFWLPLGMYRAVMSEAGGAI